MGNRHVVLIAVALAVVTGAGPVGAEDGPTPSAEVSSSASPSPGPAATVRGPRWAQVRDRDVRDAGILEHMVTLGPEAIAMAQVTDAQGQTRVRVLATEDGWSWVRRGTIRLTGSVNALLADGTVLYAAGWDEGATIWRSADAGRTWATSADPGPFAGGADGLPGTDEGAEVAAIGRGPGGLLAVGEAVDPDTLGRRAAVWRSADGLAWERVAEAGVWPSFHVLAADASTWVVIGSSSGAATSPAGADAPVLRWSADGATWTDAGAEVGAMERMDGVTALPDGGFLAWGARLDAPAAPVLTWWSTDGRSWDRGADDPALGGADLASVRSLEGGSQVVAVGGVPRGAYAFPLLGAAWRRDRIRVRTSLCVKDVASVRAILVAVGGSCGGDRQRGRAWTSPLAP